MTEEKRMLLERKKAMQDARNRMKLIDGQGLEVFDIFEENTKPTLGKVMFQRCATNYPMNVPAENKISEDVSEEELFAWIAEKLDLVEGKEYFYYCSGMWAVIKINKLFPAIKNMWFHDTLERGIGCLGFLLVDLESNRVLEVGSDSRDEENYLIDIFDGTL